MNVGNNLRELRQARGMTQDELAKAIGTTKQCIYKYEKGIVDVPLRKLGVLAEVFGVPVCEILK